MGVKRGYGYNFYILNLNLQINLNLSSSYPMTFFSIQDIQFGR